MLTREAAAEWRTWNLSEEDIVEHKEVRKVHNQGSCHDFTTVHWSGKLAADANSNLLLTVRSF